jgi:hypothetical protein
MAKKTLNEATIRRFQKLAKVAPLTETYYGRDDKTEEDMHSEGMHAKDEDMHKEEMHEEMHEEEEMDAGMDEAGSDVELTDEEAKLLIDLGEKLAGAMDDEEPTDLAVADDAAMDADDAAMDAEETEDIMEALAGIDYVPSKSEIVNEVAQRVAKRLRAAKLHEAKLNRALGKK